MAAPTEPAAERTASRPRPSRRRVLIGALVAVAILVVLGAVSLAGRSGPSGPGGPGGGGTVPVAGEPTDSMTAARSAVPRRQAGDPLALGPVNAPAVVAEWGDFQCPFCKLFSMRDEPALRTQYVDSGRVRYEWHDYAYLGPESVLGARAARAAGRQGQFWAFHDTLYRDQPRENSGQVTDASLSATAARLGLDVPRFQRDYADPAIARAVADDQEAGTRLGVNGVPSFVIGDQLIFGAQPLATFQEAIDRVLQR